MKFYNFGGGNTTNQTLKKVLKIPLVRFIIMLLYFFNLCFVILQLIMISHSVGLSDIPHPVELTTVK